MSVYVYTCVHMYMYVYTHGYKSKCIRTYVYTHVYSFIDIFIHTGKQVPYVLEPCIGGHACLNEMCSSFGVTGWVAKRVSPLDKNHVSSEAELALADLHEPTWNICKL